MSEGQFDRKQIIINSQFREAGSKSSTDFTWRFEERVEGIRHAELRYFVFENGAYNINSSNNTFLLTEYTTQAGTTPTFTDQLVTIPVGSYDDTSLASALGLSMTATSITHTVSPNIPMLYLVGFDNMGVLSITCSFGRAFQMKFTAPTYDLTAQVLGFNIGSTKSSVGSPQAFTILGDTPQQLTNYDYIYIKSQKLGNDISFFSATGVTDQSKVIPTAPKVVPPNPPPYPPPYKSPASCFAVVPNTVANSGNTYSIVYEQWRPPQIANLKRPYHLDYVDIQICDKYGQVVNAYTNNITVGIELFLDKKSEPRSTTEHHDGDTRMKCSCRGCSGC
jgi:hypothetical protein